MDKHNHVIIIHVLTSSKTTSKNYYHHRNDAFSILPVPADTQSGPHTAAELRRSGADLLAMGLIPAPPPPQPVVATIMEYVGDEQPWDFMANATVHVMDFALLPQNGITPLFYVLAVGITAGMSFNIQSRNDVGTIISNVSVDGYQDAPFATIQYLIVNNGWVDMGPFNQANYISISKLPATAGSTQTNTRLWPLPNDRTIRIYTQENAGLSGQNSMRLFGYGPVTA
jgi:hypothetical protein